MRKTWREKATSDAIAKKINRRKNPVNSLVQLAEEFGAPVNGPYYVGGRQESGKTASASFRNHVRSIMGDDTYSRIRNAAQVR